MTPHSSSHDPDDEQHESHPQHAAPGDEYPAEERLIGPRAVVFTPRPGEFITSTVYVDVEEAR